MFTKLVRLLTLALVALHLRPADEDELTPAELAEIDNALGDALLPDGAIDFDRLKQASQPLDIDSLRRKASAVDSVLEPIHHL